MKAFVEAIKITGEIPKDQTQDYILAKWLAFINQKDIKDKNILKNICKEQEEIGMAVSVLSRSSQDKLTRQEYLKRQDDIILATIKAEKYRLMEKELAEKMAIIATKDAALAENKATLAENKATLATKDAALADLEKTIAELRSQLDKNKSL